MSSLPLSDLKSFEENRISRGDHARFTDSFYGRYEQFTLIKLPRLVAMLVGGNERGEVHQRLARLLDHHTLLAMTDAW